MVVSETCRSQLSLHASMYTRGEIMSCYKGEVPLYGTKVVMVVISNTITCI